MMKGGVMGGSFLGSESFEGFLVPPFFNRSLCIDVFQKCII